MSKKKMHPANFALALLFGAGVLLPSQSSFAAELTLGEGVVVKFGTSAELIVRDTVKAGDQVTFTSVQDDSVAGQTQTTAGTPAKGDWSGVKIEGSATTVQLNGASFRYGGANGAAVLDIRKLSPVLNYLDISDSSLGVRVSSGAAPHFDGVSLLRNDVAMEISSDAVPLLLNSQIQNNVAGLNNLTPANTILATGNWWGDATGPNDSIANPAGLGDSVTDGVNYANWLTLAPLINPKLSVASGGYTIEQPNITLSLACRNAVEYRVAENNNFTGLAFQPMAASVPFTLSSGDGIKNLTVQYRASSGNILAYNMPQGILFDTQGPSLAVTNPAAGSFITQSIDISANAIDPAGVIKVEFYIDDTPVLTDTTSPYSYNWDITDVTNAEHEIKVIAYDSLGRSTLDTRTITVSKAAPPPPDTVGPALANLKFGTTAFSDASVVSANGSLSVAATDASGISRVEFALDGNTFRTDTNSSGSYTAGLDLAVIADGAHTLEISAYDSLNNSSQLTVNFTVAMAPPAAPVINQPASAYSTNQFSIGVSGTAEVYSQAQLYINTLPVGLPINVDANGNFSTTIALAEGVNQIQAAAINRGGSGVLSTAVAVTVDNTIPQSPTGLLVSAQTDGKLKLSWTRATDATVVGYDLYRSTVAFTSIIEAQKVNSTNLTLTSFDDLPPADGTYYYRVVAVNNLNTSSQPSNQVQAVADTTAPRALAIDYASTGQVDSVSGHMAPGFVTVNVTVSEPLLTTPFFSITPNNGIPITVELIKTGETQYRGVFTISETTPSGTAYAVFSGRDLVGNRGTDIVQGGTLLIDTDGPAIDLLSIAPVTPVKNDSAAPVAVTVNFTLNGALKTGEVPQLSYLLSGAGRVITPIVTPTETVPLTYQTTFTLPSDAGLTDPETVQFSYRGVDELDNVSTKINVAQNFQVYQGELPPLAAPSNLTGKALSGGQVKLSWNAVDSAASYQIYRTLVDELDLLPLGAPIMGLEFTDSTSADGSYRYAIATVRESNDQQSLSAQSDAITVVADSVTPDAPQALALAITGQGIVATWQAPATTEAVTYNLYRANTAEITSVSGLTPIKSGVGQLGAVDATPSTTDHAYVVTAVDSAGNESPLSNSEYLNVALLPVSSLSVVQRDTDWPVISWGGNSATVVGYDIYLGPDNARVKLNSTQLTATTYTDNGYGYDDRRYSVVSIDANSVEMGRSITMPQLSAQLVDGLPLKRGLMNRLQYNITNSSAEAVDNIQLEIELAGIVHKSETISLVAGETKTIPVIVGGYDTLTNLEVMEASVVVTPNEGESVRIVRTSNVDVTDGILTLAIATESLTRGGNGQVHFTLENSSDVEMEVITAINSGASASNEMRFMLMDNDNNVLATQSVNQFLGAGLITLPNGNTVARIPAGGQFTSTPISLAIPSGAPDNIYVQLVIDKLHYHVGQSDQVDIRGMTGRTQASLVDTSYFAEVTSITPPSSFGDVDIVISGRAVSRTIADLAIPSVPLNLVLRINGFERKVELFTDSSGNFSYAYPPQVNDAGIFKVSVVHPDLNERPDHGQFSINRVALNPTDIKVVVPRNYVQPVSIAATTVEGTTATNLHLVYAAEYQSDGVLPAGVTVALQQPINVGSNQKGDLKFDISADNVAEAIGSIVLKAFSDERGTTPVAEISLSYNFSEARPVLSFTPSFIETGVSMSDSVMESISLENRGLLPMQNVNLALVDTDGNPAPGWLYLTVASDQGTLAVGDKKTVDVAVNPAGAVAEGIYNYKLRVTSDNHATTDINVFVSVTQSGVGNVLFKASDIYTATLDKDGALIQGLAGAKIEVQNENVISVSETIFTDSAGEALFVALPSGNYKYRSTAANHQQIAGRFSIKPGITVAQDLFLDYNLVNVEWSVNEIAIQDKYDIRISATYETDVPAAVVVMEPLSVTLPEMNVGDLFYGELTLTNYGLIRADHLKSHLPTSDQYNSYEFLTDVPDTLEAKGRITIPYRVTRTTSLVPDGNASGGGTSCSSITGLSYSYDYECKNGDTASGSGQFSFITAGLSCSGSGGGGGVVIGGGGGGGGTSASGSPAYTPIGDVKQCKKRICISDCDVNFCQIGG